MAKEFKRSTRQQSLRSEQETRRDLSQLTDCLKETAATCASDERLTKDERDLWIKQGNIFSSSVAELKAILTDHQYEHVREHRLYKLFEALGSACFIAARVEDPIGNRLKTAGATDKKRAPTKIVVEEAVKIWREHPNHARWRVAGEIEKPVNERRSAEGLPTLSRRAIDSRLKRYQQHDRTIE